MNFQSCKFMFVLCGFIYCSACQKDDEKEVKVSTQLRSTSVGTLEIDANATTGILAKLLELPLGNSAVTVESFELPIGRINLVGGDSGAGYTMTSPNFYTCPGSSNEDCMVDVANTSLNDLLKGNTSEQVAIKVDEERSYTGTAIEICAEGSGGTGSTFKARLKASGKLGTTTYYTHASLGVSTTGPAESVEITMNCGGLQTDLPSAITVTPDSAIDLVFWADPTGGIFLTNNGALANATCYDKTPGVISFCAAMPAVFGTTVAGAVTAERYQLDVKSLPTVGGDLYGDVLVTVVTNADGKAIGAATKQLYTNTPGEIKAMAMPVISFDSITLENNLYSFGYVSQSGLVTVLSGLAKTGSSTDIKLNNLTGEELSVDAKRL